MSLRGKKKSGKGNLNLGLVTAVVSFVLTSYKAIKSPPKENFLNKVFLHFVCM